MSVLSSSSATNSNCKTNFIKLLHHHHTLFDHFQETQEVGCDQDMTHAEVRKETELFHWFRLENKKGLLIYFPYEDTHVHNNKNNFV